MVFSRLWSAACFPVWKCYATKLVLSFIRRTTWDILYNDYKNLLVCSERTNCQTVFKWMHAKKAMTASGNAQAKVDLVDLMMSIHAQDLKDQQRQALGLCFLADFLAAERRARLAGASVLVAERTVVVALADCTVELALSGASANGPNTSVSCGLRTSKQRRWSRASRCRSSGLEAGTERRRRPPPQQGPVKWIQSVMNAVIGEP